MKKKTIIILSSVVIVLLITFFAVDYYIRDSENFYPEHFKVGNFVAVNNSGKYYWYDEDSQSFTGEYTEISFKAKGIIGTDYHSDKRYRVYGKLIYGGNDMLKEGDLVLIGRWGPNLGCVTYDMEIIHTHLDGTGTDFITNQCEFIFSEDFNEPLMMLAIFADEESKVGYYGKDLEEAKANRQKYAVTIKEAEVQ